MSDSSLSSIAAHPIGATPNIKPVLPSCAAQAHRCEMALHIGVFFDGTGNNQDWVEPGQSQSQRDRKKHSNIARLMSAYPNTPENGHYLIYIPGVGTPFAEIGEIKPESLGEAFGAGGDGRINFGLLHVINSIHRSISPTDRPYAASDTVKALCRNGVRRTTSNRTGTHRSPLESPEDEAALRRVGMHATGGLLLDSWGDAPQRKAFLKRAAAEIGQKIQAATKPKPVEIFIDVFGFSRGAAEARVFTNWLLEAFEGNTLCGVPAAIRFLGLFDTVASVGLPASAGWGANGHASWGDPANLRIAPAVKNCVHYVAMHENRGSFPVDQVRQSGVLPANCQEFMFPGMHSDVGGGYSPTEQGRGPGGRTNEKLSQLPLEAMYQAAKTALVPLDRRISRDGNYDPFSVADTVRQAFNAFMGARQKTQPVREWLFEYLVWRYQSRDRYMSLPWHARASASERDDLQGANQRLLDDVEALGSCNPTAAWPGDADVGGFETSRQQRYAARINSLAPEAREVWQRAQAHPPIDAVAAAMFADYAHDSYAGFRPFDQMKILGWDPIPGSWEPEGYLRWRRRYEGNNQKLTQVEQDSTEQAA